MQRHARSAILTGGLSGSDASSTTSEPELGYEEHKDMMIWNTGDAVVDRILLQLEGLSTYRDDSDAERTGQLLSAVIDARDMLPQSVSRHFKLPNLFVGSAHFDRSQDYRRQLISEITDALKSGLADADADPQLKRDNKPDFSDRPHSLGEDILDALKAFRDTRTAASLSRLRASVTPTHLQSRVKTIEMLSTRQRPYGNQSPEVALLGELHRLEAEARNFFSKKL